MNASDEIWIRIGCFAGVLLLMAAWEWLAPRRKLSLQRPWRWSSNLGLLVVNSLLVRLLVPLTAVGGAELARSHGWGLLNLVDWPSWLEVSLSVLILDLAIFAQHVTFHKIPWLWRLHMVHHADLDFDVTTGLRFHSLEIFLSAVVKLAVIGLLGPAAVAVVIFEVLLNATSMFNHSNVRMPGPVERLLRTVLVTPDMHRVHHSVLRSESNSNFGFNLPWWDYLFRTYVAEPQQGHEGMVIGLEDWRDEHQTERLPGMLSLPFRSPPKNAPGL